MSSSNAVSNRKSYFDKQIVFQRCMKQLATTLKRSGYGSVEGSVTIPNHVNGSRNYLDYCWNQEFNWRFLIRNHNSMFICFFLDI